MSQLEVDKIIPQSGTTLTIGDSGDTITIPSGAGFQSTGIYDNSSSTSLFINSSNRVTVGTDSGYGLDNSADDFVVANIVNHSGMSIVSNASNSSSIFFTDTGNSSIGKIVYSHSSDDMKFTTANTEHMRIDSSGNFMVGKTSTGIGSAGAEFKSDGRLIATVSGNYSALLNRLSSDGDIVQFRKDGTTVGSIGVFSSDNIYISGNSSHAGIQFGSEAIFGFKNGSLTNTLDVGNASSQWRDIYLAGGLYVGGTGTANKLDDYEEGTWTPSYGFDGGGSVTMSNQEGHYVKIGKLVIATVGMSTSALSSPSGQARINGLPFTKEAVSESGFSNGLVYRWGTDFNNFGTVVIDSTSYALMYTSGFNQTQTSVVSGSDFITGTGNNRIIGVITYYTTA
jgi:hypothetical protein